MTDSQCSSVYTKRCFRSFPQAFVDAKQLFCKSLENNLKITLCFLADPIVFYLRLETYEKRKPKLNFARLKSEEISYEITFFIQVHANSSV